MMNKHVISEGTVNTTQEESGWGTILEDYSYEKIIEHSNYSYSDVDDHSFCTPSMVTDAASNAAWKVVTAGGGGTSLEPSEFPKRLNFNKARKKRLSYDEDLEDTASSPVNSPKISSMKQMETNFRRSSDNSFGDFLGKGVGSYPISGLKTSEKSSINYDEIEKINYSTALTKRGLCVIPISTISMFMNN